MSHGSSDKCEPNFTPLLDLVLQLVMFFMIVTNFVQEQTNVEIKLPEAIAAKAIAANEDYAIYLNVNAEGKVILASTDQYKDSEGNIISTLDNPAQVGTFLKRRAKEDRARSKHAKSIGKAKEGDPELSLIILRVDKACTFEKTYAIMKACRTSEYLRVQLRAIVGRGDI